MSKKKIHMALAHYIGIIFVVVIIIVIIIVIFGYSRRHKIGGLNSPCIFGFECGHGLVCDSIKKKCKVANLGSCKKTDDCVSATGCVKGTCIGL